MSDNPEDYYFKYDKNGKKVYFTKDSDKRIAKINIPEEALNEIKEWNDVCSIDELIEQRDALIQCKLEIEEEINELDARINAVKELNPKLSENTLRKRSRKLKEQEQSKAKKRWGERLSQTEEFLKTLYGDSWRTWWNPPTTQFQYNIRGTTRMQDDQQSTAKKFLHTMDITDKTSWFDWLRANHPDKGGNVQTTQAVIENGRLMGW